MAFFQLAMLYLTYLFHAFIYNICFGLVLALCLQITRKKDEAYKDTALRAFQGITDLPRLLQAAFIETRQHRRQNLIAILIIPTTDVLAFIHFKDIGKVESFFELNYDLIEICLLLSSLNIFWLGSVVGLDNKMENLVFAMAGNFCNYLEITASHLDTFISNTTCEKELQQLPKRFILIPENAEVNATFETVDERIHFVENTCSLKLDISGTAQRQYFQSIYRFSPKNEEFSEFFCIVEQSATVQAFKNLQEKGIISSDTKKKLVKRFYQLVDEMVKCSDNLKHAYEIILYTGKNEDIVDAIVNRRRELLHSF